MFTFFTWTQRNLEFRRHRKSEVRTGNLHVKAWKTTEHRLHKIWRSLKSSKISGKQAHPASQRFFIEAIAVNYWQIQHCNSNVRGAVSPFTLDVSVCVCVFENNGSNGKKTQMQRMGLNPIFYINVHVSIETMIKFNANGNVDVDAKCKRLHQASSSTLRQLCDDASDSVLIEINGDAWKLVATPFWSVITELSQRWRWRLV